MLVEDFVPLNNSKSFGPALILKTSIFVLSSLAWVRFNDAVRIFFQYSYPFLSMSDSPSDGTHSGMVIVLSDMLFTLARMVSPTAPKDSAVLASVDPNSFDALEPVVECNKASFSLRSWANSFLMADISSKSIFVVSLFLDFLRNKPNTSLLKPSSFFSFFFYEFLPSHQK